MRIATRVAGVAGATALGVMAFGATAFADSADNDGVGLLNDDNISAVPVNLCNNNVAAAIGVTAPILSPQTASCTNAPVVDHPSQQG
ncbi:hypothetical protein GCM10027174_17940 [Salinifilum aidingensis]